ncbi:MAG: hypothetical protein AAFU54_00105 [Chloroflexota bacterium]
MTQLSREQHNEIVELIEPLLGSEAERRALILETVSHNRRDRVLFNQLDFSGSVAVFVPHLLERLIAYGTLQSGESALVAVLEAASRKVGSDRSARINAIVGQLEAATDAGATGTRSEYAVNQTPVTPTHARRRRIRPGISGILLAAVVAATIVFNVLPDSLRNNLQLRVGLPSPSTIDSLTSNLSPTDVITYTPAYRPNITTTVATVASTVQVATSVVATEQNQEPLAPAANPLIVQCKATVFSPTGATMLNVVRSDDSNRGRLLTPVTVGSTVTVLEQSEGGADVWNRIIYGADLTGWIPQIYLEFETPCDF